MKQGKPLNQNGIGKTGQSHVKNKLGPLSLTPDTKVKSGWIKDLTVRHEPANYIEKNRLNPS